MGIFFFFNAKVAESSNVGNWTLQGQKRLSNENHTSNRKTLYSFSEVCGLMLFPNIKRISTRERTQGQKTCQIPLFTMHFLVVVYLLTQYVTCFSFIHIRYWIIYSMEKGYIGNWVWGGGEIQKANYLKLIPSRYKMKITNWMICFTNVKHHL